MGVARIGRTVAVALGLALLPGAATGQAAPDSTRAGLFRRATLELRLDADGGYRLSAESAPLAQGRLVGRDTLAVVDFGTLPALFVLSGSRSARGLSAL